MTYPGFPETGIDTITREAARIVLVDKNGMVPLIYSSKLDVYKIPGGGIEAGENIMTAISREAMEEVGCEIEIVGEIGEIIEKRPAHGYSKGVNLIQRSYCYFGRIMSKSEVQMSESEISRGFELVWIPVGEVLMKMSNSNTTSLKAQLVGNRDKYIFEEYLKLRDK